LAVPTVNHPDYNQMIITKRNPITFYEPPDERDHVFIMLVSGQLFPC
jgi:hypothetical protein